MSLFLWSIDTDKDGHPLTLSDVISEESNIIDDIDLRLNAEKLYHYIDDIPKTASGK